MSLLYISKEITIYAGTFFIITGFIGNSINILVFSTNRNYRQTPCTFYYLAASIVNFIYICTNFIPRVVSQTSGFDLLNFSPIWCKIRYFCVASFAQLSLNCLCLATIDQYFATSQNARVRRLSNIKFAHRIVVIMTILCMLHGSLEFLFYDILSVTKICDVVLFEFNIYIVIYLLGWITTIPSSIMILFGYLTYRNIHLTRALAEQRADRQLIRMVFIQVLLDLICIVPYGLQSVYLILTARVQKDVNTKINEGFTFVILTIITYFYYSGSCYMFLVTSSRFRRAVKNCLCCRVNTTQIGSI